MDFGIRSQHIESGTKSHGKTPIKHEGHEDLEENIFCLRDLRALRGKK